MYRLLYDELTLLCDVIYTRIHTYTSGCSIGNVETDACSVPIEHKPQSGAHFDKYSAWADGDLHLDWYGAELGQGDYMGECLAQRHSQTRGLL